MALEYGGAWRGQVEGSIRGVGVSCSADALPGVSSGGCFDGGAGVILGVVRSVGAGWLGAGVGASDQFGAWRVAPFARVALDVGCCRLDGRMEVHRGSRLYVPVRVGFPLAR